MNNLYYLSKYIINITLLIANSQSNINTNLIILKLSNNYILERTQDNKIVNIKSTKASPINNENTKVITKEFASLYQYIYKKLKYPGKAKIKLLYKFVYKIPKLKQLLKFFCNQYKNNKIIYYIKKYQFNKKLKLGGYLFYNIWGLY